MRKILLFTFLGILLGFLGLFGALSKDIHAAVALCDSATSTPCTRCTYDATQEKCIEGGSTCSFGEYDPDPNFCEQWSYNSVVCNTNIGQCIESTTPPEKCYEYIGGSFGCIPHDKGSPQCEYDTLEDCEKSASGTKKYRCNASTKTCTLAEDCQESDSSCMTSTGCESTCKEGEAVMTNTPLSRPCPTGDLSAKGGCTRIKTAFGPISTSAAGFTRFLLGFVLSIAGGIVVIIIIITGYRLMTSQGDPEKVKNARDQLTAAIVGLLFIIFSLVILELITKDVLGLPGFGG